MSNSITSYCDLIQKQGLEKTVQDNPPQEVLYLWNKETTRYFKTRELTQHDPIMTIGIKWDYTGTVLDVLNDVWSSLSSKDLQWLVTQERYPIYGLPLEQEKFRHLNSLAIKGQEERSRNSDVIVIDGVKYRPIPHTDLLLAEE